MRALPSMIKKEFIQFRRTRAMVAISLGIPLIQLLVLGFAVSTDVERIPTVVTDLDNSPVSRSIVSRLEHTRYLTVKYRTTDIRKATELLERGKVFLAVTIPRYFERDLVKGKYPQLSVISDAQNTNVALTGIGYVRNIVISWSTSFVREHGIPLSKNPVSVNTIDLEKRIWYNPEMKTAYNMIPGIIVLLLTVITMMLTGMSIVREREIGTLEQLIVSPMTRIELILGKTIPFAILGCIELLFSLLIARIIYRIPFVGSFPSFFVITIIFVFCTLGFGILISTIATTQQQALFTAWFTMVFCILMSGFFLPIENMPRTLYLLTYINPLRYYLAIVRGLLIKGTTFIELWQNTLALVIIAVTVLTIAVVRLQKKLG